MVTCYVYILGASSVPDSVKAMVPFEIDESEIFFGPCKKRLRAKIKVELNITNDNPRADLSKNKDKIYFVGLNASNSQKIRKIVWAGEMRTAMTFNQAFQELKDPKYGKIRGEVAEFRDFPLHVKPIDDGGGYDLISRLHSNQKEWISDLIDTRTEWDNFDCKQRSIRAKSDKAEFSRDICFIFNNIFFARRFGQGIDLESNENILNIFKNIDPDNGNIDAYNIFGKTSNGKPKGLTGSWLELKDDFAETLIREIKLARDKMPVTSTSEETNGKIKRKRRNNAATGC